MKTILPYQPFLSYPMHIGNGKDVADNKTSETVTLKDCLSATTNTQLHANQQMTENLNSEDARLKTFKDWPNSFISAKILAQTGFYFIGPNNDTVKCYFCKVEIGRWERGDNEVTEHMRWSQNCPLLKRRETNNIPLDATELDRLLPAETFDTCGPCGGVINVIHGSYAESSFSVPSATVQHQTSNGQSVTTTTSTPTSLKYPDHPEYAIESARLRSFEDWPKTMKQKPKELSDAGFFYTQKGDRVKCFSCGGGLRDWDENDVPWEQHAQWFSKCEYLKLMKGAEYIEKFSGGKKTANSNESSKQDTLSNDAPVERVSSKNAESQSINSESKTVCANGGGGGTDDQTNEKKLCESKLCKICFSTEYNTAFFPCGHIVACAKCASSVTKCPLCRKPYESVMRVYFS